MWLKESASGPKLFNLALGRLSSQSISLVLSCVHPQDPRLTTLLMEKAHGVLTQLAAQRQANSHTYGAVMSMHAQLGDAAGLHRVLARMVRRAFAANAGRKLGSSQAQSSIHVRVRRRGRRGTVVCCVVWSGSACSPIQSDPSRQDSLRVCTPAAPCNLCPRRPESTLHP